MLPRSHLDWEAGTTSVSGRTQVEQSPRETTGLAFYTDCAQLADRADRAARSDWGSVKRVAGGGLAGSGAGLKASHTG